MKATNKQNTFYYGWVIVLIAGLCMFFSGPGQTYSNSSFIDEYIKVFHWSRSEVSGLYSVATLIAGFAMMLVGRFIDKLGQRKMMMIAGVVLGLACFLNSWVSSMWMLAVGFFLIRLFGQGSMTLIPNTLVPQWFIKKRGVALSLMTMGSFASATFFPIINTWLIKTWDWQFAWQVWGILLLVVFVPLAFFGVRNQPEDMGLSPYGEPVPNAKSSDRETGQPSSEEDWTLHEAMRTKAFWAVLICVGIPSMINTGITFHIVSIFRQNELSMESAAMVLSMMAIVGFPISLVSGFMTEKIKTNLLLLSVFVIEVIMILVLLVATNVFVAILFGLIWGTANGIERIAMNIVWPNYFGRKHLGSINGVGVTMVVLGSSLGPLPFGVGYDLFHNYTVILLFVLILPIIGVICALIAKKPVKKSIKKINQRTGLD